MNDDGPDDALARDRDERFVGPRLDDTHSIKYTILCVGSCGHQY